MIFGVDFDFEIAFDSGISLTGVFILVWLGVGVSICVGGKVSVQFEVGIEFDFKFAFESELHLSWGGIRS